MIHTRGSDEGLEGKHLACWPLENFGFFEPKITLFRNILINLLAKFLLMQDKNLKLRASFTYPCRRAPHTFVRMSDTCVFIVVKDLA